MTKELQEIYSLRRIIEKHFCIVSDPVSIGYITPEIGSNFDIANSIHRYLANTSLDDFSDFIILGGNGTVVNTRVFNGIIRRLELKLQDQSNGLSA